MVIDYLKRLFYEAMKTGTNVIIENRTSMSPQQLQVWLSKMKQIELLSTVDTVNEDTIQYFMVGRSEVGGSDVIAGA